MITHDLGVVAGIADRVIVMYAGRPVETGTVDDDLLPPAHAVHDRACSARCPRLDATDKEPLAPIEGNPPSLVDLPAGLPVRAALPDGHRRVRRRRAAAGADRPAPATWRPAIR